MMSRIVRGSPRSANVSANFIADVDVAIFSMLLVAVGCWFGC